MAASFADFKERPCPDWYAEPQLGIFIHWGMWTIPAWAPRGESSTALFQTDYDNSFALMPYSEWYPNTMTVPGSPTQKHHAAHYGDAPYSDFRPAFDRAAEAFDANVWADLFAKAGARYVVFVTKHHDGYCLWPTEIANPWRPGWHSKRDFVGELADAVRARGMRFGVYYSGGLDWTSYHKPISNLGDMFACVPVSDDYRAYAAAQARELIDRYKPSVLWNDIAWPDKRDVPQLFADYYAAVPDGVVNDRWLGERALFESLRAPAALKAFNDNVKRRSAKGNPNHQPDPPHCDFRTVEYGDGPASSTKKWESTRGLGLAFGYNANERKEDYMTGDALTALYRDVSRRGGNLLINVGPMADGTIPDEQRTPLLALGSQLRG